MPTLAPEFQPCLEVPFPLLRSEGDRDLHDLGAHLLIVAADRLAAPGRPPAGSIPQKARILSRLARYWFRATRDILPNAMAALGREGVPERLRPLWPALSARSTLLRRLAPCRVRCAVHGCLTGAAFEEYEARGGVSSTPLPSRLRKGARLKEPLFAPFLEQEGGRRQFLSLSEMADLVGSRSVQALRKASLALFIRGHHLAWEREIILADTAFTFGWMEDGRLALADEALTPATSRYWSTRAWKPGVEPPRMERGPLLDYLGADPGPEGVPGLPPPVVASIQEGYLDLARRFGIAP